MVIDSNRTSASTELPTSVDDGTPAGHPTPAGEPPNIQQHDLFPGSRPDESRANGLRDNPALLEAMGAMILAWGYLEQTTAEKLAVMRKSFGDVRAVGGRTRPTMQKLLAELRALVAMRDRHDKQVLTVIAEIDGALQRIAQVRILLIDGAQDIVDDALLCRDVKNSPIRIELMDILRETAQIDRIRCQIGAI